MQHTLICHYGQAEAALCRSQEAALARQVRPASMAGTPRVHLDIFVDGALNVSDRPAAVHSILFALKSAPVVEVSVSWHRARGVCLLDTASHLRVQGLLQSLSVGEDLFAVCILSLDVRQHLWVIP